MHGHAMGYFRESLFQIDLVVVCTMDQVLHVEI